ncbi:ATP-dependent DNA helicase [Pseudomonas phage PIP]|nr:ATP-dependent DNA helicase [Pseudomonas phage PIP]
MVSDRLLRAGCCGIAPVDPPAASANLDPLARTFVAVGPDTRSASRFACSYGLVANTTAFFLSANRTSVSIGRVRDRALGFGHTVGQVNGRTGAVFGRFHLRVVLLSGTFSVLTVTMRPACGRMVQRPSRSSCWLDPFSPCPISHYHVVSTQGLEDYRCIMVQQCSLTVVVKSFTWDILWSHLLRAPPPDPSVAPSATWIVWYHCLDVLGYTGRAAA